MTDTTKEPTMSNAETFAIHELSLIGSQDDEMQQAMNEHILKMVRTFAEEGHSGFSAAYAIQALEKLLRFEPLTPLTGADDEWIEVGDHGDDGPCFQNRRCPRIFKDNTGAYDIDGKVFREPSGACFTSRDSRVYITFPYRPATEYVDVEASE